MYKSPHNTLQLLAESRRHLFFLDEYFIFSMQIADNAYCLFSPAVKSMTLLTNNFRFLTTSTKQNLQTCESHSSFILRFSHRQKGVIRRNQKKFSNAISKNVCCVSIDVTSKTILTNTKNKVGNLLFKFLKQTDSPVNLIFISNLSICSMCTLHHKISGREPCTFLINLSQ
ncbi:hypothetical protein EGR_02259 [Echinococcus granulosus]|uniref:Uncharacterized protein n=1 Tax=Echinococcus granulosus TaxID=6210 RepID=W6UNL5_ECHGR|nr:hypothetical protein EGR_02259 [Echinococcus granulosus]EUB62818.1 hypothetical protein EGR_02259 [Echinococcus granulosus]